MAEKKTIVVEDLDGKKTAQDWYFQLDEADVVDFEWVHLDNPAEYLQGLFNNKDSQALLNLWREMLYKSVGKREGTLLAKRPEYLEEFKHNGWFAQLFSDIIRSDDAGAEFFQKIMPRMVQEKIKNAPPSEYTKDQLLAMTDEEFEKVAGTDIKNMNETMFQIAFQRRASKAA